MLAGTAMARRAQFQFGTHLPVGPRGYVDTGLGKRPLSGTTSLATPTDVISFELDGAAELVVSKQTARRCAREHGHTIAAELALYIVHGILHTTGFDDRTPRDRTRMRAAEQAVMQRLRLRVRRSLEQAEVRADAHQLFELPAGDHDQLPP